MSTREQRFNHGATANQGGLRYSSKLVAALNKFTGGLATDVQNPMASRYGRAYDFLISADALRYREDIDSAIHQYQQALELHQDFTEAHIGVGKCLRRKGDNQGAINYFQKALKGNAFNKEVHVDLAKSYNEVGLFEKAVEHYERALKIDKTFTEARFGLALIVELNGRLDYAVRLYQEIIAQDADFLPAYNNLGSIYLRQQDYDAAETIFRDLVELAPDFGRGYLGLALTLDKSFKRWGALGAYQKVMALRPNSRNADFIKKRIMDLSHEVGRAITRQNTTLIRVK